MGKKIEKITFKRLTFHAKMPILVEIKRMYYLAKMANEK